MTGAESEMVNLEFELTDQIDGFNCQLERMAAQVLSTGAATVKDDGFPTALIDFGRSSTLTKALTGHPAVATHPMLRSKVGPSSSVGAHYCALSPGPESRALSGDAHRANAANSIALGPCTSLGDGDFVGVRRQRSLDGSVVMGDDDQIRSRGAVWLRSALLPIANASGRQAVALSECVLRQTEVPTNFLDVDIRRNVHAIRLRVCFAARERERFAGALQNPRSGLAHLTLLSFAIRCFICSRHACGSPVKISLSSFRSAFERLPRDALL